MVIVNLKDNSRLTLTISKRRSNGVVCTSFVPFEMDDIYTDYLTRRRSKKEALHLHTLGQSDSLKGELTSVPGNHNAIAKGKEELGCKHYL